MDQELEGSKSNVEFEVRKDGLFAIDDAGIETRVSDHVQHLGNAVDVEGTDASDIVEFMDRKGDPREAIIPHVDAINYPKKVFDTLANKNFAVPSLKQQTVRDLLIAYLDESRASPAQEFLLAKRMGWHDHESSFVIGGEVISADACRGIRLSGPISRYVEKFGTDGSLGDYQSKVLRRVSYSSRLMAGIALALLAPLARIIGLENGGLNFVGVKGTGKTTIFRVIGSFYGGGSVPYFMPWDMTDNAPATLGLAFCDLPLLLDELDTLEPDSTKAGGRLKTIVHRLAMGQGRTRSHHASCNESNSDFHVIYGSTSEHRLPDFMREGGSKVTGGQAARFVDVPADAGRGRKIFESLPKNRDADQYLVRLNEACRNYYGVAGLHYLRRLVRDLATQRSTLITFLDRERRSFREEVANDPSVDNRVHRRFTGLYAAGQLGVRYGILHPRCDWFMEAIASCYWAAIALDAKSTLSTAEAVDCLAEFLRANRGRLLKVKGNGAITNVSYRGSVGLIPDPDRHGKRVWLKSKVLQTSVFQPGAFFHAVEKLKKFGAIVPASNGSMSQQQRVPFLGIKEYFYVIDPKKLRTPNRDSHR